MTQALVLGALGLIVGNVIARVSLRLPADEDLRGRAPCRSCGATLKLWSVVSVFSWVARRGRCADCGARISARSPLVELAAAGVGVWSGLLGQDWLSAASTALLGWQLVLIGIVDAEHFWLPDVLTMPLMVSGLGAALLLDRSGAHHHLIGAAAGFAGLWLLAFAYRRVRGRQGLGGGDPILFAGCGAWVGWQGLPGVLVWACLAGLGLVLTRVLLRRTVSGADRLPFGVFLAIGTWIVWLTGSVGPA